MMIKLNDEYTCSLPDSTFRVVWGVICFVGVLYNFMQVMVRFAFVTEPMTINGWFWFWIVLDYL